LKKGSPTVARPDHQTGWMGSRMQLRYAAGAAERGRLAPNVAARFARRYHPTCRPATSRPAPKPMSEPAVNWHEGMFLRPHHFQAAARHHHDQLRQAGRWDVHYNWGLRAVEIDPDALRNYRFVVPRLQARPRDGTLVRVPQAGPLA